MSPDTAIILNAALELALVLAVGAMMLAPFILGRREDETNVSGAASPPPEELAA